jgi:ribose transport system substrate-binding protein
LGALASLEAAGRKDVIVVGYDATPEARAAISRGSALAADAVQDPVTIGRLTMQTVGAKLRGEAVPSRLPVPVGLVER